MLSLSTKRWPIIAAALFCGYSWLLLANTYQTQEQLHVAASVKQIANLSRQTVILSDYLKGIRTDAEHASESHALLAYFTNKDLGMSPRYGLNASLEAINDYIRKPCQKSVKGV